MFVSINSMELVLLHSMTYIDESVVRESDFQLVFTMLCVCYLSCCTSTSLFFDANYI